MLGETPMKKTIPSILTVLAFAVLAGGCESSSGPSAGDQSTRAADGMIMLYVPAGQFEMGSEDSEVDAALQMCLTYYQAGCKRSWFEVEQPVHTVQLDAYWIDQTEVTNAQYSICVGAGSCVPPASSNSDTRSAYYNDPAFATYPVIHVDWWQARTYCQWAGGRLPTEAEWEYAARGPGRRIYPWGDEYDGTRLNSCDVTCRYDWADDTYDDNFRDTAPVGSYPNGGSWVGTQDQAGNVWEWVADSFGAYSPFMQLNPAGPSSGAMRVVRGDAADGSRSVSRSAARHGMSPSSTYEYRGFRCAVSVTP
jgi:serine/threonine-protein kinase